MSFSGKRFRRTRHENIHRVLRATNVSERTIHLLTDRAPVFSFTQLDQRTFILRLQHDDNEMSQRFRLGEEFEMERHNGSKVKISYTMEGDHILHQTVKLPDGRLAHFKREFGEREAIMTLSVQGLDEQAKIYFELVE